MVWIAHWPLAKDRIKLGLERMRQLLDALGNPHNKMPPVIHVAGTNGKGSTVAFIRSILEAAGFAVHVNTSPHIERFNERIVIAGQEITDHYLFSIVEECRILAEAKGLDPSFFEGITAAAFLAFSRNKADFTIVETGLGGELDATNVVTNPLVTVLTPISLDHTNILGDTIKQIAATKSGIIKHNVPCVVSMQTSEALEVIEAAAEIKNAKTYIFEYDYGVKLKVDGSWVYEDKNTKLCLCAPYLKGDHQYINASAAIAAVLSISNINITEEILNNAMHNVRWKGRIQEVASGRLVKLLPNGSQVIVDAAHNESGAIALSNWLSAQKKMPTYLIFCMTKNRDINAFLKHFGSALDAVVAVRINSEPLSYSADDIVRLLDVDLLMQKTVASGDLDSAITYIAKSTNSAVRVLVAGSMYLISDFLLANSR